MSKKTEAPSKTSASENAPPHSTPHTMPRAATLEALGAALRHRRETLGLTLDALTAITAISKPYLSNIETARAPGPPSEEKLTKLAAALKIDEPSLQAAADWLRTPASVRDLLQQLEHAQESLAHPARRLGIAGALPVRGVPVINKVAAGRATDFGDLDYPVNVADHYVPAPDLPCADGTEVRASFAVRVTGDSMAPDYAEGDLVVVAEGAAADGDDCLVRLGARENFATTLKRIYFEKEGDTIMRLRLVPLNPAHATWKVKAEEVTGVYPVLYKITPRRGR